MLDQDQGLFDPKLVSIVVQAEQCFVDVEEMSSGTDTFRLDQLADDVVPTCALSAIIPSPMRPGLGSLLEVSLSEEFSK